MPKAKLGCVPRVTQYLCLTSIVITSHMRQAIRLRYIIMKMTSGRMFVCSSACLAFKRLKASVVIALHTLDLLISSIFQADQRDGIALEEIVFVPN